MPATPLSELPSAEVATDDRAGPSADAIVGAAAIMIERNLPYNYILESIFPHPSLLECLKGAAHIIAGDDLQYEEGEELSIAQALGGKTS